MAEIADFETGKVRFCVKGFNPGAPGCAPVFVAPMIAGKATAGKKYDIYSEKMAAEYFGAGSVAHLMAKRFFEERGGDTISFLIYADGGTKATYEIALAEDVNGLVSGSLSFAYGDRKFNIPVDPATDNIAGLVQDAVDLLSADDSLPFTASVAGSSVVLEYKNGGDVGNGLMIRFNPDSDDAFPGLNATFSQVTQGAGDPDITGLFPVLGTCRFGVMGLANGDSSHVRPAYDIITDKWSCGSEQIFGYLVSGHVATVADAITYSEQTNDRHRSIVWVLKGSKWEKYQQWDYVAYITAMFCRIARTQGASAGFNQLLSQSYSMMLDFDCANPDISLSEKEAAAKAGILLMAVNESKYIYVDVDRQNWRTEINGVPGDTWKYAHQSFQNIELADLLRLFDYKYYQNVAIVSDGYRSEIKGGRTTSPERYKDHLIAYLKDQTGVVLDPRAWNENIIVARNKSGDVGDRNRLDVCITPDFGANLLRTAFCINNDTAVR